MNITKYVCVDWKALVDAIDDIGGLDLEITKAEMKEINYLIPEVDYTTGYNTPYLEGMVCSILMELYVLCTYQKHLW